MDLSIYELGFNWRSAGLEPSALFHGALTSHWNFPHMALPFSFQTRRAALAKQAEPGQWRSLVGDSDCQSHSAAAESTADHCGLAIPTAQPQPHV